MGGRRVVFFSWGGYCGAARRLGRRLRRHAARGIPGAAVDDRAYSLAGGRHQRGQRLAQPLLPLEAAGRTELSDQHDISRLAGESAGRGTGRSLAVGQVPVDSQENDRLHRRH